VLAPSPLQCSRLFPMRHFSILPGFFSLNFSPFRRTPCCPALCLPCAPPIFLRSLPFCIAKFYKWSPQGLSPRGDFPTALYCFVFFAVFFCISPSIRLFPPTRQDVPVYRIIVSRSSNTTEALCFLTPCVPLQLPLSPPFPVLAVPCHSGCSPFSPPVLQFFFPQLPNRTV